MWHIFDYLIHILSHNYFLLVTNLTSLFVKVIIFYFLTAQVSTSRSQKKIKYYLTWALISAMFEDFAWVNILTKRIFFITTGPLYQISAFIIRIAWTFYIIEYQSLALFLEKLSEQNTKLNPRQKICIALSVCFGITFSIFAFKSIGSIQSSILLLHLEELAVLFSLFVLMAPTIWISIRKLKKSAVPYIIKKQFKILISILIIPRLLFDFIQYFPFSFAPGHFTNAYAMNGISSITLTIALFFCVRRIMGLRFLNFNSHVQSPKQFNFIDGFKEILEQLGRVTNVKELGHITQTLFKEAFSIPHARTFLYVRSRNAAKQEINRTELQVENYITNMPPSVEQYMQQAKILIYDEIDFSHFYDTKEETASIISFLDTINADIFLPIYKNQTILGYIIVERRARSDEFYSNIERDEMLVFASYLSNIINLLQNRNLESLLAQEKELKEELYQKHHEIMQHKESLRSFLKTSKHDIGIIFYRNRRFIFANQAAKEMVTINLNVQEGHPLSRALKRVAQLVEEYKSPQKIFAKDFKGNKIAISAVPHLEGNTCIITLSYPDVADVISENVDHLKDPTKWDYLLYLETTKPGQLISQLIPGSGETLLNFKIELLQLALSKKALLLEMADEDLKQTVELLHHISMRETLHAITLHQKVTTSDIIIKLFGASAVFGFAHHDKPLFEKLHEIGTLFIENIDLLDLETQQYLADYIKYGYYRPYKSDALYQSTVRIICSTTKNLTILVQEGSFSQALFLELKKASISMPSLLTLPDQELTDLAQEFTYQTLKIDDFSAALELTEKDKQKIALQRPTSLQELKQRVQYLIAQKSKKRNLENDVHFEHIYDTADPELITAARLGKHALRDERIMTMLWNKFKNQNQIAALLGVNRSSVNRRCKAYKFE